MRNIDLLNVESLLEEVKDSSTIANSALTMLYDRSCDLQIPPLFSYYVLEFILENNIKIAKETTGTPADHEAFFNSVSQEARDAWLKETGEKEVPKDAHEAMRKSLRVILKTMYSSKQIRDPGSPT
jgi:hypothetical protein